MTGVTPTSQRTWGQSGECHGHCTCEQQALHLVSASFMRIYTGGAETSKLTGPKRHGTAHASKSTAHSPPPQGIATTELISQNQKTQLAVVQPQLVACKVSAVQASKRFFGSVWWHTHMSGHYFSWAVMQKLLRPGRHSSPHHGRTAWHTHHRGAPHQRRATSPHHGRGNTATETAGRAARRRRGRASTTHDCAATIRDRLTRYCRLWQHDFPRGPPYTAHGTRQTLRGSRQRRCGRTPTCCFPFARTCLCNGLCSPRRGRGRSFR